MMTTLSLSGLSRVEVTFEQLWADGSAQLSVQLGEIEVNLLFAANAKGLATWWRTRQLEKAPTYWLMIEAERVERAQAHMRTAEFYFYHQERLSANVTEQVNRDLVTIRAGFASCAADDGPSRAASEAD